MPAALDMPTLTPGLEPLVDSDVDPRSDAEIETIIGTYRPVTHQKNCWTFWHSGFENMPRWCKRNVIGWARRLGPSWEVRCTDMVPGSPNHVYNFIGDDANCELPQCFRKNNMTGKTFAQHASDMARLPLVYINGGVWMDAGTILFKSFDDSFWNLLEDPNCPYEVFAINFHFRVHKGQILCGMFGAMKGNPFIERWMKVFFEIWKDRTECNGVRYHPLIRHLGLVNGANAVRIGIGGPRPGAAHTMVDYLAQDFCFERVRLLIDASSDWDGPRYYRDKMCFLDAEKEYWKYTALMPTELHFKLMSLPFKPDLTRESSPDAVNATGKLPGAVDLLVTDESDEDEPREAGGGGEEEEEGEKRLQQMARDWATNMGSSCLAVKFSGGYWWPESGWAMPLAVTWNLPGHEDDDVKKGTWAEWFRYASTHFRQTRKVPVYGGPGWGGVEVPDFLREEEKERVLHAGLLEPAKEEDGWEFIPPLETV